MEWLDFNHIKGEMSDSCFLDMIQTETKKRDQKKYGRDGSFVVYKEKFSYHEIPYLIKINRYFQIGVPLDQIKGMNDIAKWAVLEYTDEIKPIYQLLETLPYPIGDSEWMWRDALHHHQQNWTLKEQVEEMHKEARECIDEINNIKIRLQSHIIDLTNRVNNVLILFDKIAPIGDLEAEAKMEQEAETAKADAEAEDEAKYQEQKDHDEEMEEAYNQGPEGGDEH